MDKLQRLQKILARAGIASRRAAEKLILAGRVSINGEVTRQLGAKADPTSAVILVDGRKVPPPAAPIVLALHKPAGYLTTCQDERARRTVMALVPTVPGLHPIGRLDYATGGLLLLTNDGELTLAITHPSYKISKAYLATVTGIPSTAALERLRTGIALADGLTAPAIVQMIRSSGNQAVIAITIWEGRNRQVRRMFEAIAHPVRQLVRVAIGPIALGNLRPGQWRNLIPHEVKLLRNPPSMRETLP
ncbi:MAG: rRNA pseudouridine synthase [Cyanobacteria bacterium NC_groundwater_1444_Ag_S-0.65um_54_12]|nr:rRNA pseudouridine synthase [Cyanobacteria bacterium NC_groundwater_1444_Ag_S-0.65um_54_12]